MAETPVRDFFDTARTAAAAGMLLAAAMGIAGVFLNWVEITPPEIVPDSQRPGTLPFSGIDVAPDGWVILAAAVLMLWLGGLLWVRRRSGPAWLGFLVSTLVGGIAVGRYREIGDITSSLSDKMGIVGEARPAFGILLVIAAGVVGLLSSVAGIAATPRPRDS